ncbi:MAG TPA: Hsp20/alpha crystallin family protein [Chloroflexota bacterium]|jgi:HSP20 family protein
MLEQQERQPIRVRVYESVGRVMIAAPMPGLEPGDISVEIADDLVTIRGDYRGPLKEDRLSFSDDPTTLLLDEWRPGPYEREVSLPQPVSGFLANATYGNGVLVLVMPKREDTVGNEHVVFGLQPLVGPRGVRVGHVGRDIRPAHMEGHLARAH